MEFHVAITREKTDVETAAPAIDLSSGLMLLNNLTGLSVSPPRSLTYTYFFPLSSVVNYSPFVAARPVF